MNQSNDAECGKRAVAIYKGNVDYSGSKTTWGSHESYLYTSKPDAMPGQIVPHLVSRLIYTGAGGFNPLAAGIEFTLSPRAWHLSEVVSCGSTSERPIFHTKNERLASNGFNRMHVICGESLCSHIAAWLRVGVTAVIVAMIDGGIKPGNDVRVMSPLEALKVFVDDPTCRAKVDRLRGNSVSALDVQRHYLELAEENQAREFMPAWTADVCAAWRDMLDRIEAGPEALSNRIDWAIKRAIYIAHTERRGVPWSDLPAWNHVLEGIRRGLRESPHEGMARVELILGQTKKPSPIPDTIKNLTPYVESKGLSWDMLRPVVDLRKELFELDFRFGQLGGDGIFERLDRAGALEHRVPGVDNIDEAINNAPAEGRARLRGRRIRSYQGRTGFVCYWDEILDLNAKRRLDMLDPFATRATWKKLPDEFRVEPETIRRLRGAQPTLFDMLENNDR
jgi:hypothetical protein